MYKRLLKNSAIYGILPQLPKVATFFILPLITPYLTKTDYGIVGVLTAYIGALSVFQLLALNVVVTNAFYHHPKQYKWYWRQLYGFTWQWSLIYFVVLGILLYYALPEEAHAHRWEIIGMKLLPGLLFGPSEMLAIAHYRLQQKAIPIATRALFGGLLALTLNYVFIAKLKMGYMGWITAEFITGMVNGLIFMIPLYTKWNFSPIFNFKRRLIRKALKVSLPVIPHYYASYLLNSSDRLIMDRVHVPTSEIGRYSLAYSFGFYIETVSNAINQAVGPNLLELIKNGKWKDYTRLVFFFQLFILSICFLVSLWVQQWLPWLVRNKELQDIHVLLIVIVMSYSYRPVYIGCSAALFYYEKTNILWRITFIAGIINISANLILVPLYGVEAAALTTFASLMYMGFSGFFFKTVKQYNKAELKPVHWFVAIIASLGIALLSYDKSILLKSLLTAGVALILIVTVFRFGKEIKKKEVSNSV